MAVTIAITHDKMQQIGEPIMDAINAAQVNGATVDEVLVVMMVMLGSAIRQRGAALHLDKPLREALPSIAHGYEGMDYEPISLTNPKAQAFRDALLEKAMNG